MRNQIYTIFGKPGAGKTFFATYLASFHRRIYANYEIRRNGKLVNNMIRTIDDVERVPFSLEKGIVIIDEGGVNVNARRSSSEANMEFGRLAMLGRKKNVNIIVISQLERMTDVYFRELSGYTFSLHSWFESAGRLMFEYDLSREGQVIGSKFVDLMKWSDETGYSYDTLESGKIDLESEAKKERRGKMAEMLFT